MLLTVAGFFENAAEISILLIFALLVFSFVVLSKGADWFVEGASAIAKGLGVPKAVIGATIVSVGTTSAEAAVSVMAAFKGHSGLALGNGIGSVICNIALIFGLCSLLSTIPSDRFTIRRQGNAMLGSAILIAGGVYLLAALGIYTVPRVFGFILVALLVLYCAFSVKWARQHTASFAAFIPANNDSTPARQAPTARFVSVNALIFLMGLALVMIGSRGLIGSVDQICLYYGVPEAVVATTIVAFGTSVPELATGVASILKGHKEILLGNVVGANVLNLLFVIGAAASVRAIEVPSSFYTLHLPVTLATVGLFMFFSHITRNSYRKIYGLPLLAIYAFYIIIQYLTYEPVVG